MELDGGVCSTFCFVLFFVFVFCFVFCFFSSMVLEKRG